MDNKTKMIVEGYLYALDTIEAEQQMLASKAKLVADRFWTTHHAENEKHPFKNRSQLACRVRPSATGVVGIEWMKIVWRYPANSSPKPHYKYLKKGRNNHQYPMGRLEQLAREWEWEVVSECEKEFAVIRELSNAAGRLRTGIRAHLKALGVDLGAESESDDEEGEVTEFVPEHSRAHAAGGER